LCTQMRARVSEDIAELAVGHVRADLIARYNKDEAWESRCDAFTRVSDHIATLIGARTGAAVILARGGEPVSRRFLFLRPVVTQICEHKIKMLAKESFGVVWIAAKALCRSVVDEHGHDIGKQHAAVFHPSHEPLDRPTSGIERRIFPAL